MEIIKKKKISKRITVSLSEEDMIKLNVILKAETARSYPDIFRRMMEDYWKKHYYDKRNVSRDKGQELKEKLEKMTIEQKCEAIDKGVMHEMTGACRVPLFDYKGKQSGSLTISASKIDEYYIHNVINGQKIVA